MKKLIFSTIFAISFILNADAQIQQGNLMIGSNISNISFGLDDPNAFSFSINPKAAWFVRDGLALGTDISFGLSTRKNEGSDISYGIGALGRYYSSRGANEVINNSVFFGEATLGLQGYNPSEGGNTNGLGFSFGPGYTYFVTRNIGLEALLKYNGVVGFGSSPYTHNIGLGVGLQIYLPGRGTARSVERDIKN